MSTALSQISVTKLKGVGDKVAEKLARLSIFSLEDLLFHLPLRYEDRSRIHPINSLIHGQNAQIFGQIISTQITFGKRRALVCKLDDDQGIIQIRFFYFSMAQKKQLVEGEFLQCYGQVSQSGGQLAMVHPEIVYRKQQNTPLLREKLQPIYPTTEGLHQKKISALISQALTYLSDGSVKELLPEVLLKQLNFPALKEAIRLLHNPPLNISLNDIHSGEHPLIQRLAFEELLAQQLSLCKTKRGRLKEKAYPISEQLSLVNRFTKQLPFRLTDAQNRVIREIRNDLSLSSPMMRLVQGDVGCGKTLVAAFSMLEVVGNGLQSVLMAPTEILAEQHFKNFKQWFEKFDIHVVLLTSKMTASIKKENLQNIYSGNAQIIIGTHAVFQKQVEFNKVGLVVIDEQHRFGVEQRKALLEKSQSGSIENGQNGSQKTIQAHQLVMTATPIPRTLAQSVYADLDLSIINELPPNRVAVDTSVISDSKRAQVIEHISRACEQDGRQVYWVCTLIDESEEIESQAALVTFEELTSKLPSLNIGLVHGRLNPKEKQQIMDDFKAGAIQVLVATTVIEVGVDVPNASLMIIENPERLGLSQLHQLRGRVGRGSQKSFCLLLYKSPLSQNGKKRLAVMRETNDGFVIAEEDLKLRGAGELLGTRQTGEMLFRFADLLRDRGLLPKVQQFADSLIKNDPNLSHQLIERWVKSDSSLINV